jgi:ATP-dependent protease HslVU (ClpYQ) peptidase subunit
MEKFKRELEEKNYSELYRILIDLMKEEETEDVKTKIELVNAKITEATIQA